MTKNRYLPFGYRIRDGEYVAYEPEAELICMAYLAYVTGASYQSLAIKMQKTGVRYHADTPEWNKHMVKRMLENERYTGCGEYPAILSQELYERVQRLRESKRAQVTKPRKKDTPHIRLIPPDHVRPVPDIKIARLENQLSLELRKPVLEPDRLRGTIFKLAVMRYEACFYAQEIR